MGTELEATVLWQQFASKSTDEDRARVRSLVESATGILDRIVETFPTYTLHNHVHALNVVKLMGQLLGPACSELSALESAVLILASYYHDIGMYYREDELGALVQEEWFEQFLRTHPEAFIEFTKNDGDLTRELAEWYCRWRHADRVYVFLNEFSDDDLCWGVVPIREKLGEVCRSHNQKVSFLKDDDIFETDYLQTCDVRFCAILLRLADILDFDRSRSPEFVYSHLGFSQDVSSRRLTQSREAWCQHLAAQGFTFPADRPQPYPLPFIAGPDEPTVEHDIRAYLDTIDDELKECAVLIRSCSPRWRDLALPHSIFRDIRPRGYRYGDYRFELDREQVLGLFMGETLYSHPYVFLRELLQNAIDTTRHRVFFERSRGNQKFETAPIDVSEWLDDQSYQWVRIDDYGMGMDEQLVLDYFLSVGRSYYRSADFRAEMLRYSAQEGKAFTPISRFGIGLLSCFMIGDRIEVSSRRSPTGSKAYKPVRLSLQGLESFYIFQSDPMPPRPMPSCRGDEKGYRASSGSSIAVRIDPSKASGDFDLLALLNRFLLASPVSVTYQGEPVPSAAQSFVAAPWFSGERSLMVPVRKVEGTGQATYFDGHTVAVPLNLTAVSPDPRFRGQMALLGMRLMQKDVVNEDVVNAVPEPGQLPSPVMPRPYDIPYIYETTIRGGRWELRFQYDSKEPDIVVDLAELFKGPDARQVASILQGPLCWSHNGVSLPGLVQIKGVESGDVFEANVPLAMIFETPRSRTFDDERKSNYSQWQFVGFLSFSEDLKIDLSASRDVVRSLPWHLRSLIQFTVAKACVTANHPLTRWIIQSDPVPFDMELLGDVPLLGTLLEDRILNARDGWPSLPVLALNNSTEKASKYIGYAEQRRWMTYHLVEDLRQIVAAGRRPCPVLPSFSDIASNYPNVEFLSTLRAALTRISLGVSWAVRQETGEWNYVVTEPEAPPVTDGERVLPPLFFVPYIGHDGLRAGHGPLNRDHPFSEWFMQAIVPLREHHPSVLSVLLRDVTGSYLQSQDIPAERILRINDALDKLRKLGFSPSPSSTIALTRGDFT